MVDLRELVAMLDLVAIDERAMVKGLTGESNGEKRPQSTEPFLHTLLLIFEVDGDICKVGSSVG